MGGVLSQDVKAADLLSRIAFYHLGGGLAGDRRQGNLPGFLELGPDASIGHRLVADMDVGKGAHITGPLDVVLAAQRHDASRAAANVSGEHCQVAQGHHIGGSSGVLSYAQAVDDHRFIGPGIEPGGLDDILCRHSGDLGCPFRRILLHRLLQVLKSHGAPVYEIPVLQPFFKDHIHHCIYQGDACSRFLVEPDRCPVDQLDFTGVSDDYLRSISGCLDYLQADYGMGFSGIGADDEKDIGVFNLVKRVGGRSAAKAGGKTGH